LRNHVKVADVQKLPARSRLAWEFLAFKVRPMRWSIMLMCMAQAGCALSDAVPETSPSVPDAAALARIVEQVSRESKLPAPIEVSPLRAAHPVSPAQWVFCLKSSAPDQLRRYAVFMKANDLAAVRLGVLIDGCDNDTYQPFVKTP
jgi:hypothetical protein